MKHDWQKMPRRSIAEINIVPYVDVMLVLLVIFMITTPIIMQGVQVDLPQAAAKPLSVEDSLPIVVTVTSEGSLYLNIQENPSQIITSEDLQIEVAAALVRNPGRFVSVKADKEVSYDTVLQVMVLLQHAGVDSVGLETVDHAS